VVPELKYLFWTEFRGTKQLKWCLYRRQCSVLSIELSQRFSVQQLPNMKYASVVSVQASNHPSYLTIPG
jgi:hypothetical protein